MAPSPWTIAPTNENFEVEVIERSMTTPVVVDFWATWCAPCLQLAPILDKLTAEFAGKFFLAKIDTDKQPDLAAAFGVQSIPLVVIVKNGQIADGFQGVKSEAEVRAWIQQQMPSPTEQLIAAAAALEATAASEAEAKYREALAVEPAHEGAKIGLARVLCLREKYDEAQTIIEDLEKRGYLEPEAETLKAKIALHAAAEESGIFQAPHGLAHPLARARLRNRFLVHLVRRIACRCCADNVCSMLSSRACWVARLRYLVCAVHRVPPCTPHARRCIRMRQDGDLAFARQILQL